MLKSVILDGVSALTLVAQGRKEPEAPIAAAKTAGTTPAEPATPAPAQADTDMQKVLTRLASLGCKPIETLEPPKPANSRRPPTP